MIVSTKIQHLIENCGGDDQNIYEFRGSSSELFCKLITNYGAKRYDLVDNYRSDKQIVAFANSFAAAISRRMKTAPVVSKSDKQGKVILVKHTCSGSFETALVNSLKNNYKSGTCSVLTSTNAEALSILGILMKNGIKSKLIQSNDGFDLTNIAEMRYFLKTIDDHCQTPKISLEIWDNAKIQLQKQYEGSACLNLVLEMIKTFEESYSEKYLTDFQAFLRESSLEDFHRTEKNVVTVSTIHKAKGREFDSVYMYLSNLNAATDEEKRRLYVGFTRAKKFLHIDYRGLFLDSFKDFATDFIIDGTEHQKPEQLIVALTHKDINLNFFKPLKSEILKLRSGQDLGVSSSDFLYHNGNAILKFSKAFTEKLAEYQKLGYKPISAKIRFVLSWFCEDDGKDYAIILPMVYLGRN